MPDETSSDTESGRAERRRGATVRSQDDAVAAGAVAADGTQPTGDPHPPAPAQAPETGDPDVDLAFDPTQAGGPIPEGGLWMQTPVFMDEFVVPTGTTGDEQVGEFITIRSDVATHIPAAYVQQVRTAAWCSFPRGGFTVAEFEENPTPPPVPPSPVTSLDL